MEPLPALNALQLRDGWREVLDDWNVGTLLIPPYTPLSQALLVDPHWVASYRDSQAVVFVRAREKSSLAGITYGTIVKTSQK